MSPKPMSTRGTLETGQSGIHAPPIDRDSSQVRPWPATSDWSGRGQLHVDFEPKDEIPLTEGRFLGHGSFGDVHEVFGKNGLVAARKRLHLGKRLKIEECKREVEIIQKLNHHHIIKYIGSYTVSRTFNLLLWPAAACDLQSFLDDLDDFPIDDNSEGHWEALGISAKEIGAHEKPLNALNFLKASLGCIANAVEYLHASDIRHKDLKPQNILLVKSGCYLIDFGIGWDFSELSKSYTSGPLSGTLKYSSPEMAKYKPRGRSSDIYSLGCIFLEIVTVLHGKSLSEFEKFRNTNGDRSYHGNPYKVQNWLNQLSEAASYNGWEDDIFPLIRKMLSERPEERPSAAQVSLEFYSRGGSPSVHHMPCCQGNILTANQRNRMRNEIECLQAQEKEKINCISALNDELDALKRELAQNKKTEKPIEFKDTVGRSFSFPFHLCQTWKGMEKLIFEVFLHMGGIDSRAVEGQYDLARSDGEIILPQVWESMIEPGWAITMCWRSMPYPKGIHHFSSDGGQNESGNKSLSPRIPSKKVFLEIPKLSEDEKEQINKRYSNANSNYAKLQRLRRGNQISRATATEMRCELRRTRLEMVRLDEGLMKFVGEYRATQLNNKEDFLVFEMQFTQIQATRNTYSNLEESYNAIEEQLGKEEYEIIQLIEELQHKSILSPQSNESDTLSPIFYDYLLDGLENDNHAVHDEYLSRQRDADLVHKDRVEFEYKYRKLQEAFALRPKTDIAQFFGR